MVKHIIWSIERLANTIQQAIDNKFDFIIAVDGRRGLGKSTFAVKTAKRFKQFKMKKHILFKRDEINKGLAKTKKGVFVLDEMINVIHNRDFYEQEQKKLIKMLNMYRDSGNVIFACVPNFAHLDNQFRDLVKMRIHIERRGLGVIHTPNQSAYSKDKWDMSINEKIEASWAKRGVYNPNYKRLTTFRGLIHFNKLTEKQQILYDKIKQEKRNLAIADEEPEEKVSNAQRVWKLLKEGLIVKEDIKKIAMAYRSTSNNLMTLLRREAEKEGVDFNSVLQQAPKEVKLTNSLTQKFKKKLPSMVTQSKWA